MNDNELKDLASQLKNPHGKKGIEIADMMYQSNLPMIQHCVSMLGVKNNEKILELGYGNARHLLDVFDGLNIDYTGLDISTLMKQEAIKFYQNCDKFSHVKFLLYDGKQIPFDDDTFDKIITVNTLYFWENPKEFFKELYRVLKMGGKLIITFIEKDFLDTLPFAQYSFNSYNREILEQIINPNNFKIFNYQTQSDNIMSKTGKSITRVFSSILLQKI